MFTTTQLIVYCFIALLVGNALGMGISALFSMGGNHIYIDDKHRKPRIFCKQHRSICIGCPNLYDCYDEEELENLRKIIYESKNI